MIALSYGELNYTVLNNIFLGVAKFFVISFSFSIIGIALALAFLLPEKDGYFLNGGIRLKRYLRPLLSLWSLSAISLFLTELAVIVDRPVSKVFEGNLMRSFAQQVVLGKLLMITIFASLLLILIAPFIKRTGGALLILLISTFGLLAPYLENHSAASGDHMLAIGLILLHIFALAIWVGGVIGLILMGRQDRELVRDRFHHIALWALVAVGLSGIINGWIRLEGISQIKTRYGLLLIAKFLLFLTVFTIAYFYHRKIQRGAESFAAQLIVQMSIFLSTIILGILLGRSAAPESSNEVEINPILGSVMPGPPTISRLIFKYEPDGLFLTLLVVLVILYIKGVILLAKRGDKWPISRSISFALGISLADYAVNGGLGVYSHLSFSFHMVSHMVLATLAPIGIVLGAPITLALRTLPIGRNSSERGIRGFLIALLNSRYSKFITNPIVAMLIFDISMFALYFTNLFQWLMSDHFGHFFMELHFFIAGFLFFFSVIGIDPAPKRIPFIARIVVIFAAISIHAFFSVSLMSATTLVDGGYFASLNRPWWGDLLADQKNGAAIGWAFGELPILIALAATFSQWIRADAREGARFERNSERAKRAGLPDELEKYNKYLESLDER